ncbi:hypothetical protein [Chitinophaga qingshengii]|uniref:Uncharacterized protein n=1 Tax=Chitinophaga qingshengii TaxID=1569794 RepID=A0ABR7TW66_9BACT|nr:hypothetical protein [Chitinophaga qingshengii]MBC9934732.1 hypothetical protein [Chitinophaga qingshengii]
MHFDDIQSLWNKDDGGDDMVVPVNLEKIKSANQPVERIRQYVKREGWGQLLAIVLLGYAPHFCKTELQVVAYYSLYSVMVAICGYYLYRFFRFYRRLGTTALSTREHLDEVYYDIQLHVEMYRSWTYAILMLALGFATIRLLTSPGVVIDSTMVIKMILLFAVFMLLIVVCTELWIRYTYGRYLKEIKKIRGELREEL